MKRLSIFFSLFILTAFLFSACSSEPAQDENEHETMQDDAAESEITETPKEGKEVALSELFGDDVLEFVEDETLVMDELKADNIIFYIDVDANIIYTDQPDHPSLQKELSAFMEGNVMYLEENDQRIALNVLPVADLKINSVKFGKMDVQYLTGYECTTLKAGECYHTERSGWISPQEDISFCMMKDGGKNDCTKGLPFTDKVWVNYYSDEGCTKLTLEGLVGFSNCAK